MYALLYNGEVTSQMLQTKLVYVIGRFSCNLVIAQCVDDICGDHLLAVYTCSGTSAEDYLVSIGYFGAHISVKEIALLFSTLVEISFKQRVNFFFKKHLQCIVPKIDFRCKI